MKKFIIILNKKIVIEYDTKEEVEKFVNGLSGEEKAKIYIYCCQGNGFDY